MFIHHPEGRIRIEDEVFTLEEFLTVEPGYSLPESATGRNYNRKVHITIGLKGPSARDPVPWPEGEGYIQKKDNYRTILDATKPPALEPPTDEEGIDLAFSIGDHNQIAFAMLLELNNELRGIQTLPQPTLTEVEFKDLLKTKLPVLPTNP